MHIFAVVPLPEPRTAASLKNLCGSVDICADLHLFDAHDRKLHIVQGTNDKIKFLDDNYNE